MAATLSTKGLRFLSRTKTNVCKHFVRFKWEPPSPHDEDLPSFEERISALRAMKELKASDGINIGLHFTSTTTKAKSLERVRKWSRERHSLEKLARHGQIHIDMDKVKEEWNKESGPIHISRIAKHYGIFDDMFDGAHYNPTVPLKVLFDYDEEFVTPVHSGNIIPASEAGVEPYVSYLTDEKDKDSLWTLVMTSPDGNLETNDKELLHWMVSNIPGDDLNKGETLCKYMQPFPVKGAGYLRYVFVLYKQACPIDLKNEQRQTDCYSLRERTFSTYDFYREHEETLTPAGLAFFQSTWDSSVRSFFHHSLDLPEPCFEFIHPPPYLPPQRDYPHREPFNIYLDQYRDKKDIMEDVLKHKLKSVDPFEAPQHRPRYPNTELLPGKTPSWLKQQIYKQRLGADHWKRLYDNSKE